MESLTGVSQKAISMKIDLSKHHRLTTQTANYVALINQARLASLGLPHSGDYLYVIPSKSLGLHLRTPDWVSSVKYRLGCSVFSQDGQCPACTKPSDKWGDHAISVPFSQLTISSVVVSKNRQEKLLQLENVQPDITIAMDLLTQ